jgi:hypothetical protein
MASSYSPWGPSTGPGSFYGFMPPYNAFQQQQIGVNPGYGYTSNLGFNNTPNPGPPAADINGILLEPSANEFIALETGSGGPTDVLIQQP